MPVTRLPNGITDNDITGIYKDLRAPNVRAVWVELEDFDRILDPGGGDSQWIEFGDSAGNEAYPDIPWGVIELDVPAAETYGFNQENCQGFDFTLGTDLWFRSYLTTDVADMAAWTGMANAVPTGPGFTVYDEACIFQVLITGEITLDVWSSGSAVQIFTELGTMPRDGTTYVEVGYHYDGERLSIEIDGVNVADALMPIVPDIALHKVFAAASVTGGSAFFDYLYGAQTRT